MIRGCWPEQASSSAQPLDLVTLHADDGSRVAAAIGQLPGVVITPQAELLPTDKHFAPAVLNDQERPSSR